MAGIAGVSWAWRKVKRVKEKTKPRTKQKTAFGVRSEIPEVVTTSSLSFPPLHRKAPREAQLERGEGNGEECQRTELSPRDRSCCAFLLHPFFLVTLNFLKGKVRVITSKRVYSVSRMSAHVTLINA